MGRKKKLIYSGIPIFFIILLVGGYWYYFSTPSAFPAKEQMEEQINQLFPKAELQTIQEVMMIDDQHAYVPFITKNQDYGKSFWVWTKHKWQVTYIDTEGNPLVWKINRDDPSTYYIVWNMDPRDQLQKIRYYLLRERHFQMGNGHETYQPSIQMEVIASLEDSLYGVLPLPEDWQVVINAIKKSQSVKGSAMEQGVYFGWNPNDMEGQEAFPHHSVNGDSYTLGKEDIAHVMIISEEDLE